MSPAPTSLVVVGVALVLYFTEWIPLGVTAVGACVAMVLLGVVPFSVAFSGFASDVVFLVGGMIVVGAALAETGASQLLGEFLLRRGGGSERRLLGVAILAAALLSAFLNNTSVTALFIPVVAGMAASSRGRIRPGNLLMPIAFAASAGGMLTLVGSTPPLIVQGVLEKAGLRPFGFFEFAWVGAPIVLLLLVYSLVLGYPLTGRLLAGRAVVLPEAWSAGAASRRPSRVKVGLSVGIMLLCVALFASEAIPPGLTAVLGAVLVIVTGCITDKETYRRMDWNTVFVLAGSMGIAAALDKSGGGRMLADLVLGVLGPSVSPFTVLAAVSGLGLVLTQVTSNTAVTAMLAPIALFLSQKMGVSPHPMLMALATTCAAAFATPVATPPNTLVLGAGYRFTDYVLVGGLLTLLSYAVVLLVVPLVWPF
ncbi:MAG: SLC13 family permease [Candidatus Bipolaricaulota bacterium]|nr:SLC13 family permease [Candidatus Bipolaricaulota bacterium]